MSFLDPWMKNGFKILRYKSSFALFRQIATIVMSRTTEKVKSYHVATAFSVDNSKHRTARDTGSFPNRKWGLPAIGKQNKTKPPKKNWPQVKVSVCAADQPTSRMQQTKSPGFCSPRFPRTTFHIFFFLSFSLSFFLSYLLFAVWRWGSFRRLYIFSAHQSLIGSPRLCRRLNFFCILGGSVIGLGCSAVRVGPKSVFGGSARMVHRQ